MKQYEAVIKVMEENEGFATLGYLNQNIFKIKNCEWKTKTPFASIRRIVQDSSFFFKIKPGLWALKSYKNKLPFNISTEISVKQRQEFDHTYYQGLLVEIGNLKKYQTFVSNQDKNKTFLNGKLKEITTIENIYQFSYDYIVKRAQAIDVVWFNNRKLPDSLFEIEHSTDFLNSLLKFIELQDFYVKFFIIADERKKSEYNSKISSNTFESIKKRIEFVTYERVSKWHTSMSELASIEGKIL